MERRTEIDGGLLPMNSTIEPSIPSILSPPIVLALFRRPRLWSTALKVGLSLSPSQWWRSKPFLPLPDRNWLHFRLVTAYGGTGDDTEIKPTDLVEWLEWRKEIGQLTSE